MSLTWRPRRLLYRLAVVVTFAIALQYAFHAVFFPWSVPLPGRSALTGSWYGAWPGDPAGTQHVAVELEAMTERCTPPCSRLDAVARICGRNGVIEYDGHGSVRNWSGSSFYVSFAPRGVVTMTHPSSFRLEGSWRGREVDALVVIGPVPHGSMSVTEAHGPPPPATPIPLRLLREGQAVAAAACRID